MSNSLQSSLTFSDLTVDQLAEHAFNLYLSQGAHPLGARLIYEALKQDPYHVLSLRCMADFLNQSGLELFSAITLEYAIIYMESSDEAEIDAIGELRRLSLWSWGFSQHKSRKTDLQLADFKDPTAFEIDHEKYESFMAQLLDRAASLEAAFSAAHRLCGVMAQFLIHKESEKSAEFAELFNGENYHYHPNYDAWLNSYEPMLDQLMDERLIFEMDKNTVT